MNKRKKEHLDALKTILEFETRNWIKKAIEHEISQLSPKKEQNAGRKINPNQKQVI